MAWPLALAVTACTAEGSGEDTPADEGAVAAAKAVIEEYTAPITEFPEVAPVDGAADLAGKNVWFVPVSASPPAFQVYADALTEALSHLDVEVHVCDGEFVPTAIASCLDQAGSSGADAVITEHVDYALVAPAVDALLEQGVKVLLAGQALPEGESNSETLAFHDTFDQQILLQELTANALIADSGGDANILYIGTKDSETLVATADRTEAYIDEKCPGCSVTRIEHNLTSLDKVPSQVSAALIKAPETDYIFCELDTTVPLAVAGLRAAGFETKVKIGGMGGDLAVMQEIARDGGPVIATAGSFLAYSSWLYADDMVRMLSGQAPADEGLQAPARLFTRDNVADLDLSPEGYASMDWYGNDAYEDLYLTAWGAK
jgi:ribose transport system substrate-binding protein